MSKRTEFKQHLEKQVLSCMLNDIKSIPLIANKLQKENLTGKNANLFESILQHSHKIETPENLMVILMRDYPDLVSYLIQIQELQISMNALLGNQILESFLDICFTEETEKLLSGYLNRAKSEITGLDLLNEIKTELDQKLQQVEKFREEKPFSMREVITDIETEIRDGNKEAIKIKSIPSINCAAGGFYPSNLIGVAGSFKSGKTTLALNLIMDIIKQNIGCGLFSLELSENETKKKIAGMLSGVPYENLREPKKLTEEHKQKLLKAYSQFDKIPLYISDKTMTEQEIYNKAKYWKDRFNIKTVIIDYIGYIKSKRRFDSREREVSHYSNFLKQLAKELNLVVIALAQLNRTGKANPTVDNLAESISLARDCDSLFLIYNPLDCGIKNLRGITLNDSHFICRMDVTRHSKNSKKDFLLQLEDSGIFKEILTQYEFPKKTTKPFKVDHVINYYEPQDMDLN